MMETEKLKVFMSKTISLFFFQGCMKGLGVILGDTVNFVQSSVPLVSWSFTFMEGLSFLFGPIISRLLDFFSIRLITTIGGVLTGVGFICEAFFACNIYFLFISNFITGCGFGLLSLPTTVALANSFGRQYGTALSIVALVSNIGMVLLPPLIEHFREEYGLSGSVALLGALMWNQILCGILLPVKSKRNSSTSSGQIALNEQNLKRSGMNKTIHRGDNEPLLTSSSTPLKSPAQPTKKPHQSIIRAHPSLMFLFPAQFFHLIIFMAWSMYLVPYGISKGYPPSRAVILSTVGGCGVMTGRALTIIVFHFELMGSSLIVVSPCLLLVCLFVACVFTQTFAVALILSFAIGMCLGFLASWMFAYIKNSTCPEHFKSAVAWSSTWIGVGVFLTGLVSGLVHDIRGSYNDVFAFLAFIAVCQTVFTFPAIILTTPECKNEK